MTVFSSLILNFGNKLTYTIDLIYHVTGNISAHRFDVDTVYIVRSDSQTYPGTKIAAYSCKKRRCTQSLYTTVYSC